MELQDDRGSGVSPVSSETQLAPQQENAGNTSACIRATNAEQHGGANDCGPVAPGVLEAEGHPGARGKRTSKNGRDANTTVPEWQKISGLTPLAEPKMSRSERRLALRKLFRHYETMVREALAEHERETADEKFERSFLWDPLSTICIELGIARRKLSALTRELTGMAAHEVIDKVRAEVLQEKVEAKLAEFFREKVVPGKADVSGPLDLWERLRKFRRNPAFEPVSLALEYGFPNYARLRRGCMLAHGGATPRQMELRVLEKFSEWYKVAASLARRLDAMDEMRFTWVAENEGKPWNDRWARETEARPDWIARMRALLGLNGALEEFSAQTVVPAHKDERLRQACERTRAMIAAEAERKRLKEEEKRLAEEKLREQADEQAGKKKSDG